MGTKVRSRISMKAALVRWPSTAIRIRCIGTHTGKMDFAANRRRALTGHSGDYGPNFLGHVLGATTYLVNHPTFGWISFGGNVDSGNGSLISVEPRDAVRQRIFVAPVSLYVTIDAGTITSFTFNTAMNEVVVSIVGSNADSVAAQRAVLSWEQTGGSDAATLELGSTLAQGLGGYLVDLPANETATVTFSAC